MLATFSHLLNVLYKAVFVWLGVKLKSLIWLLVHSIHLYIYFFKVDDLYHIQHTHHSASFACEGITILCGLVYLPWSFYTHCVSAGSSVQPLSDQVFVEHSLMCVAFLRNNFEPFLASIEFTLVWILVIFITLLLQLYYDLKTYFLSSRFNANIYFAFSIYILCNM